MASLANQASHAETEYQNRDSDPPTTGDVLQTEEPERPKDWESVMQSFFDKIGFEETSRAFETEMIILSNANRANLPTYILQLVNSMLSIIENNDNDISRPETDIQGNNEDGMNSAKRKRTEEDDHDPAEERLKRINPDQVQIRASGSELRKRIDNFIQAKKSEVDASNRTEFLKRKEPSDNEVTCARTDAREIDRSIQMKFDVVNNEDGPLARSLVTSANHFKVASTVHRESGADERLQNLEQHLNILYKNNSRDSFSLFERIKIIEDTLILIENQNPLWAAVYFNQPNRTFPPPPVINLITPTESASESTFEPKSYTSATVSPSQTPPLKPTGRANSSLTRAVIEQLARRQKQS
ncbi:hypothetical protein Unana1_05101 [Umbelopsis nana]